MNNKYVSLLESQYKYSNIINYRSLRKIFI